MNSLIIIGVVGAAFAVASFSEHDNVALCERIEQLGESNKIVLLKANRTSKYIEPFLYCVLSNQQDLPPTGNDPPMENYNDMLRMSPHGLGLCWVATHLDLNKKLVLKFNNRLFALGILLVGSVAALSATQVYLNNDLYRDCNEKSDYSNEFKRFAIRQ